MSAIEVVRSIKSILLFMFIIGFNYHLIQSAFETIPKDKLEVKAGSFENTLGSYELVSKSLHLNKSLHFNKLMQICDELIKPMLYSHIIVHLGLLGLLAIFFFVYAGVFVYKERIEEIKIPDVFRYIFNSWALVSPIYTVLYGMMFYELIRFANEMPDYAEINESAKKLGMQLQNLAFTNALGLIYMLVKCVIYLIKGCASHVQIKPIESPMKSNQPFFSSA